MVRLEGKTLTIDKLAAIAGGQEVSLSTEALERVGRSHETLMREATKRIIYGVNTGFGPMAHTLIGAEDLAQLQRNLVVSHACGAGAPLEARYARATLAVRLNTLLRGDSGVSVELLGLMAALLNAGVAPVIPERGGVGASGDLIQLAHVALMLIGEGDVLWRKERVPATRAFEALGLVPHVLRPKEGLALINGTSCMTAIAALTVHEARALMDASLRAGALALEVVGGFDDALSRKLHAARPHPGQEAVAARLRELTRGSTLLRSRAQFERSQALGSGTKRLSHPAQDVYSLRCIPQVVGPVLEALYAAHGTIEIELNSSTDNPLIVGREVLHGGNFHGEYVAAAMDTLKRALTKLSMLSERRLNYLLNEKLSGLPPFINLGTPGLTLGLQGLQFTATSTVALNQTLSYPMSLHSIPSNADNQDVVSMGADAALLCAQVARGNAIVQAIELIALSQAAGARKLERRLSPSGRALLSGVRTFAKPARDDRPQGAVVDALTTRLREGRLL